MRRLILLAATAAAVLGPLPHAHAAGWALTLDTPLDYTFDKSTAAKQQSAGTTKDWSSGRSSGSVSGSKAVLIAPFHVGIGYEDYSVAKNVDQQGVFVAKGIVSIRMVDLVVDIPTRFFNLGLGYGTGTANVDFTNTAIGTIPVHNINASQVFATLGIPLGPRLDLHVGYHVVTIAEKDITYQAAAPYNKVEASGSMLSAGLRLNF